MFRNETHHLFLFLYCPKADHQETMAASTTTTPLETVMESPGWNPYDAGAADGVTAGGTAHVLVQKEIRSNQAIRAACHGNNEYYGGIGIYFPNLRHRRFLYHSYAGQDEALLNKVCKCVLQYSNAQQMPLLYTWDGMNSALLMDQQAH